MIKYQSRGKLVGSSSLRCSRITFFKSLNSSSIFNEDVLSLFRTTRCLVFFLDSLKRRAVSCERNNLVPSGAIIQSRVHSSGSLHFRIYRSSSEIGRDIINYPLLLVTGSLAKVISFLNWTCSINSQKRFGLYAHYAYSIDM